MDILYHVLLLYGEFITVFSELNSNMKLNVLTSGNLLDFAKSCKPGMSIFRTNNNVSGAPIEYCEGYIISADSNISIVAHAMTTSDVYMNQKKSGTDIFMGWVKISVTQAEQ